VSKEIAPGATPDNTPDSGDSHPAFPAVYVERALVNPVDEDLGKEVVVLGNTTITAVDLSGWSIMDKNNNAEVLSGVLLPAGGSVPIVLSGGGAQLSNKGGTIRLMNPAGVLIHAVSYAKGDAVEGRFVRFST
jgi:hypothetical protein